MACNKLVPDAITALRQPSILSAANNFKGLRTRFYVHVTFGGVLNTTCCLLAMEATEQLGPMDIDEKEGESETTSQRNNEEEEEVASELV